MFRVREKGDGEEKTNKEASAPNLIWIRSQPPMEKGPLFPFLQKMSYEDQREAAGCQPGLGR